MAEQAVEVPFLDIRATYLELQDELDSAYAQVMDSGWFVLGSQLNEFESEFSNYVGASDCVGVGNGLDALTLSLRALEVGPGDEVIVPSNTFVATWLAVSAVGARPIPVEPDEATQNILAGDVEPLITARTRAVIPVHLYGRPANMIPILNLAKSYGIRVIADAAQAHGATLGERQMGGFGDAVCWSFYPGKNLGAFGDGGAVTTDIPEVADRIRLLRNYGSRTRYMHEAPGVNSRLDELQAAVLRVKLRHLDDWNARRGRIANRYLSELDDIDGLVLPAPLGASTSSWHLFVVRHPERDLVQAGLGAASVQTLIHYPVPPHRQAAYQDSPFGPLPRAERLAREVLSLPIGPHMDSAQVDLVVDSLAAIGSF